MKLLLCRKCFNIFSLKQNFTKTCRCESTGGMYTDNINALVFGEADKYTCIGFNNHSLAKAIENQPENGMGFRFEAFVIPKQVPSIKRVSKQEYYEIIGKNE